MFCPQWAEEGVYWGLRYVNKRLLEVCDEMQRAQSQRERSKSLPASPVMASTPPSPHLVSDPETLQPLDLFEGYKKESLNPNFTQQESRREPPFKRVRVTELKQLFEGNSVVPVLI